ncbi:hypothetical protein Q5M85_17460 [Paraclostridium bifermentans]|nr:hypothetical protein [Paraclostridium bifermentans]
MGSQIKYKKLLRLLILTTIFINKPEKEYSSRQSSPSLSMVACSSTEGDDKGQDKAFLKDAKKSFNARTSYLADVESGKVTSNENEFLKEAVLKEKNILGKYKDAEFDNPELGKLAKDYIEGLNKQEESIKYYSSDFMKYEKLWTEGYDMRSTAITTLVDKFGLELDEKSFEELKIMLK